MNCPMTGKPCPNEKVFTISETVGEFTHTTRCCRSCAPDYVDFRNKSVASSEAPAPASDATSLLLKLFGSDFAQMLGGPVLIQKLGAIPMSLMPAAPAQPAEPVKDIPAPKACSGCGSTLADLQKAKRLGCQTCYKTFEKELATCIPKAQGGKSKHNGKTPKNLNQKTEEVEEAGVPEVPEVSEGDSKTQTLITILKKEMQQSIDEEDYEKAAQCRDLIKKYGGSVED